MSLVLKLLFYGFDAATLKTEVGEIIDFVGVLEKHGAQEPSQAGKSVQKEIRNKWILRKA